MADPVSLTKFLNNDLYDVLRWLFVSAVTWEAMEQRKKADKDCPGNQDAISMLASLTQARALYEFFFADQQKPKKKQKNKNDDARVRDFAQRWNRNTSQLYDKYMGPGKAINKRVSHLVYNRSKHSGGSDPNESDHLKNQVLKFAKEIRDLTEQLAQQADAPFAAAIRGALEKALDKAKETAKHYDITNPL